MDYVILLDLFCIFLIIATPIFMQRTAYQTIHENKFKLIKLKKIGFLFKGMQGQSATSHGVIWPMLVVQIQGYILGIIALIFMVCVLEFEFVDITLVSLIIIATLIIHCFICVVVTEIAGFIGKKR